MWIIILGLGEHRPTAKKSLRSKQHERVLCGRVCKSIGHCGYLCKNCGIWQLLLVVLCRDDLRFKGENLLTYKEMHWRVKIGEASRKKTTSTSMLAHVSYTCKLFFSKMHEIFRLHRTWISELPTPSEGCRSFRKTSEDRRRFPTTSEDFLTTSEDKPRCRQISKQGTLKISKRFPINLEHYLRAPKMLWPLLKRF